MQSYNRTMSKNRKRLVIFLVRAFAVTAIIAACVVGLLELWPRRVAHPAVQSIHGILAIEHARIYVSPTDPPIPDGTVLVVNGRIAAVGPDIAVPATATILYGQAHGREGVGRIHRIQTLP
jgi:hypothetical protein